jgi:hypothetical protein
VLERGEFPGAKNMFGGVLYGHDLGQIVPDFVQKGCPIERNIVESRIFYLSETGGFNISYRDQAFSEERRHNAFTVGRAKFDRWYADQAKANGAVIVCATVVTDLLKDNAGRVIGVRTDRADGDRIDHVGGRLALRDERRPLVDQAVVQPAGFVVAVGVGVQQEAAEVGAQVVREEHRVSSRRAQPRTPRSRLPTPGQEPATAPPSSRRRHGGS